MYYHLIPGSDIKVNLLTLAFSGDLENAFQEDYFRNSLWHVRIITIIALFFYSVFGVLDAMLVPAVKEYFWFIRFALLAPLIILSFCFSFIPYFKKAWQFLNASIVTAAGLGIIAMTMIAPYPHNYSYYAGLILVFIFGYTLFKIRFLFATVAGWIIVCAYEIAAIWLSPTPVPILLNNNFFFLSGNLAGMCACYSIEFMTRKNFAQALLLGREREKVAAANRELEARVQERTAELVQANKVLRAEMQERQKAQEALAQSEQLFRSLSENAPDIIYTLDLKGRFTYVNPAWERLLGHKPEEVLNRYFGDFVPQEKLRTYVRIFKQIRNNDLTLSDYDGEIFTKDGAIRYFSLAGSPNLDAHGQIIGLVGLFKDITARRLAEQELKLQKAYLEQLIENAPEGIVVQDSLGRITKINEEFTRLFGYVPAEALGARLSHIIRGPDTVDQEEVLSIQEAASRRVQTEAVRWRKDGTPVHVSILATPITTEKGIVGVYSIFRDITHRKQAEEALRESEERHRTVLQAAPDPVVVYGMDGRVSYLNPAYTRVFGWTLEELLEQTIGDSLPEPERQENLQLIAKVLRGETLSGTEIRRTTKDGRMVDVSVSGGVFYKGGGCPEGCVITFQDITARKQTEDQLKYLAYHDMLTGLPNRKAFYERMEDMLIQSQRRKNSKLWALLFLDLDRFKDVNDTLGHDIGDLLLKEVANRIESCLRKSDFIFRLGGDEFTVILTNLSKDIDAAKVAQNVLDAVSQPLSLTNYELYPTISIGISLHPVDGQGVEVLVKNSDMAMYSAKETGNQYRFYTEEMNVRAMDRVKLEGRLRTALQQDQFSLYYQPLVDKDQKIAGMEALIRWIHPEMGLVPPDKFIPIAEETGIIVPIGEWVIRQACKQTREWHQRGYADLYVAVNLSPRQFGQANLVELVEHILEDTGLSHQYLKLEITESSVMENPEEAISKMKKLHDRGIKISIDDFGTGYSSLSYLKRFPVDTLKIDRSFVREVTRNNDDREIIKTIIAMARSLRLDVVAEGVETLEQQDFLSDQGCQYMQGYLFSRPLPGPEFEQLLQKSGPPTPAEKPVTPSEPFFGPATPKELSSTKK